MGSEMCIRDRALSDASSTNPLSTGARGGQGVAGNTFTVDYKADPGFDYDPDTYTIGVTYTISAQ